MSSDTIVLENDHLWSTPQPHPKAITQQTQQTNSKENGQIDAPSASHPTHLVHSGSTEADAKSPVKNKKRGRPVGLPKKPKGYPRRPLTAYNIFFRNEHMRLIEETNRKAIRFEEIAKRIGQKWKTITKEELKRITLEAQSDLTRYREEIAHYEEKQARAAERTLTKQFEDADRMLASDHKYSTTASTTTPVAQVENFIQSGQEGRYQDQPKDDQPKETKIVIINEDTVTNYCFCDVCSGVEEDEKDIDWHDVFDWDDEFTRVQNERIRDLDEEIHVRLERLDWLLRSNNDELRHVVF